METPMDSDLRRVQTLDESRVYAFSISSPVAKPKTQPGSTRLWQWIWVKIAPPKLNWLVVSTIFYFPFHIWDVILPIDSYFSRWLLHHQPVIHLIIGRMGPPFDPSLNKRFWF